MRIIFMGTPEFAVASLESLIAAGANVVAVVTASDKRGGRGGKRLLESAVKKAAEQHGLPVMQPKSLRAKSFLTQLRALKADLQVVVAFRMLPRLVWDMPPLGTINLHGSLLPAYRGAAPIHWAVIKGERTTGVTTFFLKHAIDTGDLLLQRSLDIGPDETTGEVYARLMQLGAECLVESVEFIAQGKTQGRPQDDSKASHAPKIFHADCEVDWAQAARPGRTAAVTIHDFIRGMSPFPLAWTTLDSKELKLVRSSVTEVVTNLPAGWLYPLASEETRFGESASLGITTGDYVVELLEVKPAGKRKMTGSDLRNGLRTREPRPLKP